MVVHMHLNTRLFQRARFEVWIVWTFGFEIHFIESTISTVMKHGRIREHHIQKLSVRILILNIKPNFLVFIHF